ncbi:hypothetical protein BC829DRAFT_399398 [Chytridium lagenaria]|nr:hypothetical protein BC829DRAFT_399398 [Chytridium lagenaria]
MIYGASTVMQLRTSSALYITLYFVLAPWITIVISTGTTNPLQFIAVPVFYGTMIFCLWTVRNREYKLRRIYIMEKLYSQRFNIDIDTVCNMPTFAFHHRRLTKCFEGDIKCLEIPTIKLNRWPRFKKWFRRDVLLTWDDLNIERTYLAWRQAGFLSYMRQTVFLLAIFDLYSALMDPISFCELKGSHAKSPSMCGEKGEILRNIRLCLLPVILASFGISFSKCIREYSSGSQNLFLIVLSLRGLAFMLALIIRWDRRDETGFIILSALISQFFIVCGSSALLIDKLIIHCGVLLAGAVTTIIANKEGQIFMLMLIFVVISLCVYYGIQMERHEHRFFAMWEVLCGNDVEV